MRNIILKGIVASAVFFILGWLVYGILLDEVMNEHMNPALDAIMRPDDGMIWWAMILGNLGLGFLLAYIFVKAKVRGFWGHVQTSAIIGLFYAIAVDFMNYSMMDMATFSWLIVDVVIMIVLMALMGAAASLVGNPKEEA